MRSQSMSGGYSQQSYQQPAQQPMWVPPGAPQHMQQRILEVQNLCISPIRSSSPESAIQKSRSILATCIGLLVLCCFPPVAIAWDSVSGVHITPNVYSETITVDSAHAMWDSDVGSDKTTMLLLVDPHCSYKVSFAVCLIAAASRFCLLYSSQVAGLGR